MSSGERPIALTHQHLRHDRLVRFVCQLIFFNLIWFSNHSILIRIIKQLKIQLQTVDHSARLSMKIAASCDNRCELQDTTSTWSLNAYCSFGSFPELRLTEGRISKTHIEGLFEREPLRHFPVRLLRYLRFSHIERTYARLTKRFNGVTTLHVVAALSAKPL